MLVIIPAQGTDNDNKVNPFYRGKKDAYLPKVLDMIYFSLNSLGNII